jgi:transposase-like protein
MNLLELQKKFNTELKCLLYLEKLRWGKTVKCPYCHSIKTKRLKSEAKRHHCNDCKRNFSVFVGTIFQDTRQPLKNWFLMVALILNAKKGISAKQLQKNIGCSYKTAWYTAMRVRCAMVDDCDYALQNIVEVDETYVGGKPRKSNTRKPDNVPDLTNISQKRGRGTKKVPIVGIVERKGKIVLKVIEKLTSRNLLSMLQQNVDTDNAIVITDKFKSYNKFDDLVEHLTIDHSKQYSKGMIHINNIEGFWAILKGSIKGQYVSVSKKYLPFYLVQSQYIFNSRTFSGNLFEEYLKLAVSDPKCFIHYKPKKAVKSIVYPKNKKGVCV